jgi:hypothetical protein
MATLVSVEEKVPADGRDAFEWLRDAVENADDAEGLPEAFTHGNYNGWAAVGKPGNLVVVGWAGSGRGPRLAALAWLLKTASKGSPSTDYINAVVRGYREHVQLAEEEVDRLAGVINLVPLNMACFYYRTSVHTGYIPTGNERWWPKPEAAEQLAAKAIEAFRT